MAGLVVQIARCTARTLASSKSTTTRLSAPTVNLLQPVLRTITTTGYLKKDRLYTNKHEWITVDGKLGTIGISDYAQDALGDVVYAQLPDIGAKINKEDECGALESVKAASELFSPVSGLVVAKNQAVESKPSLINTSCYKEGWLFKVELKNPEELKDLMNEEDYRKYLKSNPY